MNSRGGDGGGAAPTAGKKTPRRRKNRQKKRNSVEKGGARGMNHERRQRKKSASSVESDILLKAETRVKEAQIEEKDESIESHLPALAGSEDGAAKGRDSSSRGQVRRWFSSLSWEERASVSSIDDTAFLATLVELASSSSGTHHHSTAGKTASATSRGGPKGES